MNGSAGFQYFNEVTAKMDAYRQTFSAQQKRQLAALRRAAIKHDLLGDWKPLIDKALDIWGA